MDLANIPLLSVLLALVATFLGLAVLVQIVQEVYKHLTSSKARTYNMVLKDFLGPWITQLSNYGGFSNLEIRGPFQFLRRWPSGKTLPFEKKELIHALEKTITPWHQRTLQIIKLEVELQSGEEQRPSQSWKAFLKEMTSVHRGMTGYWSAREVVDFLETWDHKVEEIESTSISPGGHSVELSEWKIKAPRKMNAAKLHRAFRSEFLSHIDDVDAQYNQFTQNFDHAYKRRNTRHSFIIGLTIALIFNLPFQRIYQRAGSMSQDDAIALAERTLALYEKYDSSAVNQRVALVDTVGLDSAIAQSLNDFRETLVLIRGEQADTTNGTSATITSRNYLIAEVAASPLWQWNWAWDGMPLYLLGCLVTALLTSFGAPFWKDITSLILRVQKRGKSVQNSQSSDA